MAEEDKEEEEVAAQPSFKLTYFPFAGRAASLRLAAFLGGLSYTDEIVTMKEHQTAKKQNGRRWNGMYMYIYTYIYIYIYKL